jgi:hypothetical protein
MAQTCPRGLKTGGKRLWTAVTAKWELEQHEAELLTQACRTVDRLDRLDAAAREGLLTIEGRANPVLVEARQQSIALARLLAALCCRTRPRCARSAERALAACTWSAAATLGQGGRREAAAA